MTKFYGFDSDEHGLIGLIQYKNALEMAIKTFKSTYERAFMAELTTLLETSKIERLKGIMRGRINSTKKTVRILNDVLAPVDKKIKEWEKEIYHKKR